MFCTFQGGILNLSIISTRRQLPILLAKSAKYNILYRTHMSSIDPEIINRNKWTGNDPLPEIDPCIYKLICEEKIRQVEGLELIASENFTSRAVLECLATCLTNKYSEGYPGQRYYGGNVVIDKIEKLAQSRALEAFKLDPEKWGVNVQPYSGSPANFGTYTGLLKPHDRIMGLDLPDGGHLTHGFMAGQKRISSTSLYFESMPYKINIETGLIDYVKLRENAKLFKPRLIIAGASAYARLIDYKVMKEICNEVGAYLMADIAHISGLISAETIPSPFEFCDVVTTTTHKSLRGPRAGVIFYRIGLKEVNSKGEEIMYDLKSQIDSAVFPGLQGGPHDNVIAAVAVTFKEAMKPEFREYQVQVIKNAKTIATKLIENDFKIITDGTDTHVFLVDMKPKGIDGARTEFILEQCHITVNKNMVPGDKSALSPGGIRIGTPALTTRKMNEIDFQQVAAFIIRAVVVAQKAKNMCTGRLKEWKEFVMTNEEIKGEWQVIAEEVKIFSLKFPMPGFNEK